MAVERGFLRADLEGFTFLGVHTRVGDGPHLIVQSIDGWDDGVDMRRTQTDRLAAHGAFAAPGYWSPRTITISGVCIADSPAALTNAARRFRGILASGDESTLTVTDALGALTARVARASAPTFKIHGHDAVVADFSITLWASDPCQYGAEHTYSGKSVTPWHRGNAPAVPNVTVKGSYPSGYILGYGAREFIVSRALVSSRPHSIDMRTGWLSESGSVIAGAVTRAEVFTIAPGDSNTLLTLEPRTSGSGTVTVAVRDTYI